MPSTDGGDGGGGTSRRRALAALGTAGVGGAVLGFGAGATVGLDAFTGPSACDSTPLSSSPTEWPFPRSDRGNTGRAPALSAPDGRLRERWRVEVPRAHDVGQPVVANGQVVVSAASEYWTVAALDLRDGSERWRVGFPDADRANPVVAAGDSVFYAGETAGRQLVALAAADGSERWRLPTEVGHFTPMVAGGRAFAAGARDEGSTVTTFDAASGGECWSTDLAGRAHGWPAFDADRAFVSLHLNDGDSEPGVVSLDRRNGEVAWEAARGDEGFETPAVAADTVFVPAFPARLYAFDAASGERLWRVESEHYLDEGVDAGGNRYARPSFEVGAATGDAVVVVQRVHSDYSDRVRAYDAASGELQWEHTPRSTRGTRYAGGTVAGDSVYVCEHDRSEGVSRLLRLDVASGERREAVELPGAGGRPVVAEGAVVVATREHVVVLARE